MYFHIFQKQMKIDKTSLGNMELLLDIFLFFFKKENNRVINYYKGLIFLEFIFKEP